MATQVAFRQVLGQRARRADARQRASRGRQRLAGTLETTLQPRFAARSELRSAQRVPHDNRDAAATPVWEIILLLRNPAVSISDAVLRRITGLTTHPASPLYGQYSTQARYAAFALAAELRTRAAARGEIGTA